MSEWSVDETLGLAGPRRPSAGPFERWPLATDLLIALLSLIATLAMWSRFDWSLDTPLGVVAYLLAFIAHFALLWRRRNPLVVHGLVLLIAVLVELAFPVSGLVALLVSLYSLGRFEADSRSSLAGALAAMVLVVTGLDVFSLPAAGEWLAGGSVLLVWYVGRRLRFRGEYLRLLEERAEHMTRERHADAERAVIAERTRIAREMHDVIAHQVSLMTVQAGAARTVMARDPEAAGSAIGAVEQAGRQALSEMRHLLGVLRPAENGGPLGPQPSLADLSTLVDRVREAGPDVRFVNRLDSSALPARLQLAVYRIVQEALTNVIKHAGDDVRVEVHLGRDADDLHVLVRDDGTGGTSASSGGHGLSGMRERAEMLGGSLVADPMPDGGFEVKVRLPIEEVAG